MRLSRRAKRHIQTTILITFCISLGYAILFGKGGFRDLQKARAAERQLQIEKLQLEEDRRALEDLIDRLENDPNLIEQLGREGGMGFDGDIILHLRQRQANPAESPTEQSGKKPDTR